MQKHLYDTTCGPTNKGFKKLQFNSNIQFKNFKGKDESII